MRPLIMRFFLPLVCLALLPICALAEGEVTFKMDLPAGGIGLLRTDYSSITCAVTENGKKKKTVTETIDRTKYYFSKTAVGMTMTLIYVGISEKVNGKDIPIDAVDKALLNSPIKYEFDGVGQLIAVRGIEEIFNKARKLIPKKDLPDFDNEVSPATVEELVKASWEADSQPFIGLVKKPGDTWENTGKVHLFTPEMTTQTTKYSFENMATALGRPCALIKSTLQADPTVVAADLRAQLSNEFDLPEDIDPEFTVNNFSNEATITIDPTLIFPLSKNSSCNYSYKMTVEDEEELSVEHQEFYNMRSELLKK